MYDLPPGMKPKPKSIGKCQLCGEEITNKSNWEIYHQGAEDEPVQLAHINCCTDCPNRPTDELECCDLYEHDLCDLPDANDSEEIEL